MSTPERPKSVFISYTRDDAAYAKRLYAQLMDFRGRPGASVFFDQRSLETGERWSPAIDKAIALGGPRLGQYRELQRRLSANP